MFPANEEDAKFVLPNEQVRWALAVKEAALQNESLKKLSDYEYVQHAVFCSGDVERSLTQIEGLQQFREEYKITDTLEEGIAMVRQFHDQQPWIFLDIGYEDDHFVVVCDYAATNPAAGLADLRTCLGGYYYICQIATANLKALSDGIVIVSEISGMGFQNVSVDFMRTYWEHFFCFYAIKIKEANWMNNSVWGNMFESLHKSIFDAERGQNIRVGVKSDAFEGRLDAIFKVPTPEIAFDRFMGTCQTLLAKRFHHQQSYHLPTAPALTEEEILLLEAREELDYDDEEDSHDEASEDEPE